MLTLFGLSQIVEHPTHIHNNVCKSLIDLVFFSDVSFLSKCQVIPPLSNSDHLGIQVKIKTKLKLGSSHHSTARTIWRYTFADWSYACDLIDNYDWESLFDPDINVYWSRWLEAFLEIMELAIPTSVLLPCKNLPWMTKAIKRAMCVRDRLFKKVAYSVKYRRARNKVINMLRKAKSAYFKRLNPKDVRSFWKALKYLNKKKDFHHC